MNGSVNRASRQVGLPLIVVIAVLYFGREFFIPLALAILFTFLLVPLVRRLERWKLPRVAAVISTTVLAFSIIGGLGYIIGEQLIDLASDLPKYKSNLHAKVVS